MTKTILITGATSGIGRATALRLAASGHRVVATGRNREALASLRREAGDADLQVLRLDVTNRDEIAEAAKEVDALTDGAGVDVLINNAGYGVVAPVAELPESELRALYETNVFGLMAVTQAFVPAMQRRRAGTVINISSVGGRLTLPFLGSYNSTKYAIESLSDALRAELRSFGVNVVIVEPGLINTNFTPRSTTQVERFADASSNYADALQNLDSVVARTEAMGVPPERIAQVIDRIVASRRPRSRYVAPFSAWLSLALARVVPTRWLDAVLWRATQLGASSRKSLAPVAR